MTEVFQTQRYLHQRCADINFFNPYHRVRIRSVSATNYPYPYILTTRYPYPIRICYNSFSSHDFSWMKISKIDLTYLLSRRSRQRQRLHASGLSICLYVRLSVCHSACLIFSKTKQFRATPGRARSNALAIKLLPWLRPSGLRKVRS